MVDDVAKLGELLKLPNLEQETITLINAKMREAIGDLKPVTPEFKNEMQMIFDEWQNGKEGGER